MRNTPPELDQVFGSVFTKLAALLVFVLGGYLIYQHVTRPDLEVIGDNELRLKRLNDGHYHASGQINGIPVKFLLDTGASMVSVPQSLARQAGLDCDAPASFTTANGKVQGCVALRQTVEFGPFRVYDVDIALMPSMDGPALLGMNVLGRFDLQQSNGTLAIRTKQVK